MREVKLSLSEAKIALQNLKGTRLKLTVNRGRNKFECFNGIIVDLYPFIFTVMPEDDQIPLQTFAYSDLLTKNVILKRLQ